MSLPPYAKEKNISPDHSGAVTAPRVIDPKQDIS